ncbi:50S ribosomal protein L18Ae [uncultured archaeon]|nr:50S ribosomal protein L18Ae [uncultured archaeon]
MEQKAFTVSGTFMEGRTAQKFEKEIFAHNEAFAREKTFSIFGSNHGSKRNAIKILKIEEKKEGKEGKAGKERGKK